MNNIWQLQDAKSKLSELVDRALTQGAQIITRRGRKAVVVLPYAEYERLTRGSGGLAKYLLSSPLAGSDLAVERNQDLPREIGIEP